METEGRHLPDWVDAYIDYSSGSAAPEIFGRWSAISAIAGALERKVWVYTQGSNLYPNLYTILVGPPGTGKTEAIITSDRLIRDMVDHHISPTSLTKASLIDALNDARRSIMPVTPGEPWAEFHSLYVVALELGVLMPGYDYEFVNTLTSIYDGHPYAERRRTKDLNLKIEAPQINLLGATTPSYLNAFMPEGAWDQGFISRCILVYHGTKILRNLFDVPQKREKQYRDLLHDLKIIGRQYGKIGFTPECEGLLNEWHISKGPPIPDHPRLQHYNTRRTAHLLKLCMVAAYSEGQPSIIDVRHFQRALNWLLEVEDLMPDIFRSMTGGGDSKAIEEAWHFVYSTAAKGPTPEHRLVAFLSERVPSHSVMKVIETMENGRMIIPEINTTTGMKSYKAAPRAAF